MKIDIITIHGLSNFGSSFQAYALNKYLIECGYNAEMIDYNPTYFPPMTMRSRIGRLCNQKAYKTRENKFRTFAKKNMRLSSCCYKKYSDFIEHPLDADIYVAGGDQLWNTYHPCGRDDVYKLTFTKGKKISYGTSMGRSNFSEDELSELGSKLNDFCAVSVRETCSVKQLNSVGIPAVHCVDPVMLLGIEEYKHFVFAPNKVPYLLVYLVNPSPILDKTIRFISQKLKLRVILCGGFSKRCECDELLKDVGPEEVLSYIVNSEFVLSASFHATLFSMLFHKQFAALLPDVNTNERIVDLLDIYGLSDRIIRSESMIDDKLLAKIDFSTADELAERNIKTSKQFLHDAIKKCAEV